MEGQDGGKISRIDKKHVMCFPCLSAKQVMFLLRNTNGQNRKRKQNPVFCTDNLDR